MKFLLRLFAICGLIVTSQGLRAWDYEGHHAINQLAVTTLPTNFPAFARTARMTTRIGFLAGEPDRWRNTTDLSLRHVNGPDHYIDMEQLDIYGIKPESLPRLRYDFIAHLALVRNADPSKFKEMESGRNDDHTRQLVGLLPWAITENYAKLKSCCSYLKTFETSGGTPEEIANAQQDIVYVMGVMGHYIGDASQPLHATMHHHGWVGENPNHYSTKSSFHSWIDGGFFNQMGGADLAGMRATARPAQVIMYKGHPAAPDEIFPAVIEFIQKTEAEVEPLYKLDKEGKLTPSSPTAHEGKRYLETQMLRSVQLLGDIWLTAWEQAGPDSFLAGQLSKRKAAQ
jgi:hypothetical protein